jgi:hypothetical protein
LLVLADSVLPFSPDIISKVVVVVVVVVVMVMVGGETTGSRIDDPEKADGPNSQFIRQ